MKRYYFYIITSWLICLYIYVFYRTDRTVVNQILLTIFSEKKYTAFRHSVFIGSFNAYIIYSLPEGLWVFITTLISKNIFFETAHKKISCAIVPLLLAFLIEALQFVHITHGRFDFADLTVSILFWMIARYLIRNPYPEVNIRGKYTIQHALLFISYVSIYLSYVKKM